MTDGTHVVLGRITNASFGWGGYQDTMVGLTVGIAGTAWSVGDFTGTFLTDDTPVVAELAGATLRFLARLLVQAKVKSVDKLVGVPVEVTFDGQVLKSWRVLEEVL